jgi:hypothetical protein
MMDWRLEMQEAIPDFLTVAELARVPLKRADFNVEVCPAPHSAPPRLPLGKIAVYGFWYGGEWMKIGMAGPNSNARYTSQHYHPGSAPSTLAASMLKDPEMAGKITADNQPVGQWMKSNCSRVNILIDNSHGMLVLALLEAFLHLRLRPRYEK